MVPAMEYAENYGPIKRRPKKEISKWWARKREKEYSRGNWRETVST
jgi:hypothetical protein